MPKVTTRTVKSVPQADVDKKFRTSKRLRRATAALNQTPLIQLRQTLQLTVTPTSVRARGLTTIAHVSTTTANQKVSKSPTRMQLLQVLMRPGKTLGRQYRSRRQLQRLRLLELQRQSVQVRLHRMYQRLNLQFYDYSTEHAKAKRFNC